MSELVVMGDRRTRRLQRARYVGPWRLELGSGDGVRAVALARGERLVIGSGEGADLRVPDVSVSQRHVELFAAEDGLSINDLDSMNGTFFGAARVRRAVLTGKAGSIVIGRTTVCISALEEGQTEPDHESVPGLVGKSAVIRQLAADVRRYAQLKAPVLVLGETGSGKEVVARGLHQLSQRSGTFVGVNVGALHETLADAELFGHSRGAFTGAVRSRQGAFQEAAEGTLFLDEIADLSPSIQVKLLRVLEERSLRPLGGGAPVPVTARIVSACWAQLDDPESSTFRADLFHRISTIVVRVPPLRQRKADIHLLASFLLHRNQAEFGPKELSPGALAQLVDYHWPGNVRQLGTVLYRSAARTEGTIIDARTVEDALFDGRRPCGMTRDDAIAFLTQHHGNVSAAARAARVPRGTFRSWLEREPRSA